MNTNLRTKEESIVNDGMGEARRNPLKRGKHIGVLTKEARSRLQDITAVSKVYNYTLLTVLYSQHTDVVSLKKATKGTTLLRSEEEQK